MNLVLSPVTYSLWCPVATRPPLSLCNHFARSSLPSLPPPLASSRICPTETTLDVAARARVQLSTSSVEEHADRSTTTVLADDDSQMQVDPGPPEPQAHSRVPANGQPSVLNGSTHEQEQLEAEQARKQPASASASASDDPPRPAPRPRVRPVSPRTLNELKSSQELVYVMFCAVQAHQHLYERAGVLHGDINPNTILILDWPRPRRCPSPHGEGASEGEGFTEGALVDFDVPYSAAAWRHPRPGPFKWENHSKLRMRRYGFY
ncbi:hypothetical protein C8T65DRAFT_836365, partial [Cerioporus squamosus]